MRDAGDIALRIPDNLVVTLEVRSTTTLLLYAHECSLKALQHTMVWLHGRARAGSDSLHAERPSVGIACGNGVFTQA
jgi:hypothetical protein